MKTGNIVVIVIIAVILVLAVIKIIKDKKEVQSAQAVEPAAATAHINRYWGIEASIFCPINTYS